MSEVALRVLVVLGYLLGATDPTDSQAVGKLSLMVAGLIVALFLFYLALSGPAIRLLDRMWHWGRSTILIRTTSGKRV